MKRDPRPTIRQNLIAAVIAALPTATFAAPPVGTLPGGATVINGTVVLSQPAINQLQIANTPGAIVNWDSFSIGRDAAVNIVQQTAASAMLNRVTGAGGSEIFGQLSSNGRVFLINTNGILFGAGSRVDVSGLVASTRDISNADFLAGNYLFEGASDGNVRLENDALIRTSTAGGGQVWLFANRVETQAGSYIQTPQGQSVLAAGDRISVGDNGSGYMSFSVAARAGQSIEHLGNIAAERGAAGLFADSVVIDGNVDVRSAGNSPTAASPAGTIHVAAARDVTLNDGARLNASGGQYGNGGRIGIEAGNRVTIARGADVAADGGASGTSGGRIDIAGNEVLIDPGFGGPTSVHAAGREAGLDGTVSIVRRAPIAGAISSYLPVSTTGGADFYPAVSFLDDGGFVVVWMEQNAPAGTIWNVDYSTIYGRRFDAAGQPLGAPFQVSTVSNYQYDPKVIGLDGGGFFVVWAYKEARPASGTTGWENHLGKLYGRMFDRNGAPLGADIRISEDFGESDAAKIVQLAGGRFLVTWNNETSNYPNPLVVGKRGQLFDASGTPLGAPLSLLAPATADGAMAPALSYIVPVGSGGFAQVYQRRMVGSLGVPTVSKVFAQRYANDGTPTGSEIALSSAHQVFFLESVIALSNGDIVAALRTEDPVTHQYKLHFGIYGADGTPKRVDQPLDTAGSNLYSRLSALADGGFAALWKHSETAAGGDTDTYTRRFAADGTAVEAARVLTNVSQTTGIDQTNIAAGADGRYIAAWSENSKPAGSSSYTAYEIRAGLVTPQAGAAAAGAPIAGALPDQNTYASRPGVANGVVESPVRCLDQCPPLVSVPEPIAVSPEPIAVAPAPPGPLVPTPLPIPEVHRRPQVTESRHNDERRVTPTGLDDFIFPGQATHFAGEIAVRPVVDAEGKVARYELAVQGKPEGDGRRPVVTASGSEDEDRRR